ncbi:ribosome biogenesis GTP-binding protein YihA/YsxC [Candidatus Erwinia haradaeae]|uniref:Probable GTP-binding protein EngB n=1 Tax=Candidatus Erwinia haradaeae TaxID=1922217 RepID=A0A451DK77_9GAMM|nr:ribosome biogenesis GTP-binding protein YihA/YsxC [Candidatus Erwinia haradaeae]VFP87113.1 Probable GTP-binding protein EngB [Candidatus Erwinia haradaeae]
MSVFDYHLTRFITSSPGLHHLPADNGIEVAFIGRSNAGKSSALNACTNQKNLARTSKMPGCTQFINLFQISEGYRLVDLPGYGYSNAPVVIKKKRNTILVEYLKNRQSLKGLLILMDIRHPLKKLDQKMILSAIGYNIPVLVLLTKADKLNYKNCIIQLNTVRQLTKIFSSIIKVQLFSAKKTIGINTLHQQLDDWYHDDLTKKIR